MQVLKTHERHIRQVTLVLGRIHVIHFYQSLQVEGQVDFRSNHKESNTLSVLLLVCMFQHAIVTCTVCVFRNIIEGRESSCDV
jgi:hypothetical protein